MQAVGTILVVAWMVMVVIAVITLIRGRVGWLRLRSRKSGARLLAASLPVVVVAGLMLPKPTATTTAAPTTSASAAATATAAATTTVKPSTVAPTTSRQLAATPSPTTAAPVAAKPLSCSDIGGVFVAHGTDGRGDCEPADPRPKCHIPPGQQDPNYVPDFELTPPFPGGTVDRGEIELALSPIAHSTNLDCWKLPSQ
jgi:hypothetical protein